MKKTVSVLLVTVMVLSIFGMQMVSATEPTITTTTVQEEAYTELYRMDFDGMQTAALSNDLTAFNNAYGSDAKLLSTNAANLQYAILEKTAGGNDKYIDLKQDQGNAMTAIQIAIPDGGIKANNGTYKLSFDAMIPTGTYVPYLRVKTYHYPTTGFDHWGPCLAAIAPMNDSGKADKESKNLSGTYSTWDFVSGNGIEPTSNSWGVSGNLESTNKASLEFEKWIKVDIKIDTINKKAHYYYNGKYIGSQEGNTFAEKYLCGTNTAKYIQIHSIQNYQVWSGCKLDNITFSHSKSGVVNPSAPLVKTVKYEELYRLDFDAMAEKGHSEDGTAFSSTDLTAAYPTAKIYTTQANSSSYAIGAREEGGSDKYLEMKVLNTAVTTSTSKEGRMALEVVLPEAAKIMTSSTGTYKISYDAKWLSGPGGNKPVHRLISSHYTNGALDNFGWNLSAIGSLVTDEDVPVLSETMPNNTWTAGMRSPYASGVYGTFGTETAMATTQKFPTSFATKGIVNLAGDTWHKVEMIINADKKTIDYYYDGIYAGTKTDMLKHNMIRLQFHTAQEFQVWNGFQLDNIIISKAVESTDWKAEGFEGASAVDLSANSKKLTLTTGGAIGEIKDVVIVNGATGQKVDAEVIKTANTINIGFASALGTNGVYRVYVVGENAYIAGKLILGTGVTEVMETETELMSLELTDDNGESIAAGDTVTAKAVLRNGTSTTQTGYLILAIYNDGNLSDVDFKPISSKRGLFDGTVSLTVESAENVEVSAFVWNNLSDVEPMGAACTLE
ncbi:MAG: hypothetical protein IJB80_06240 [Clostridia bacterium]|nr:hypothetical protein [Clostridia bacterium]